MQHPGTNFILKVFLASLILICQISEAQEPGTPGTVFVVAQNGDQADTCVLTITGIPVTGIDILKDCYSLIVGSLLMMDYTLKPA